MVTAADVKPAELAVEFVVATVRHQLQHTRLQRQNPRLRLPHRSRLQHSRRRPQGHRSFASTDVAPKRIEYTSIGVGVGSFGRNPSSSLSCAQARNFAAKSESSILEKVVGLLALHPNVSTRVQGVG